jgi:hypothetical protein
MIDLAQPTHISDRTTTYAEEGRQKTKQNTRVAGCREKKNVIEEAKI